MKVMCKSINNTNKDDCGVFGKQKHNKKNIKTQN